MEKTRTLKKKDLSGGHSLVLVKYSTDCLKDLMSQETQKGWNPKFDGSYEIIIGLDKQEGRFKKEFYRYNTHPKLSWYLGTEYFTKLYDKISSLEDFYAVNKFLGECLVPHMNHQNTTEKVEGLLKLLEKEK